MKARFARSLTALSLAVSALTGCSSPEATAPEATSGGEAVARHHGLELMSPDAPMVAYADLRAARESAIGSMLRSYLGVSEDEGVRELVSRLFDADRLWFFGGPRGEGIDVVLMVEGAEVESLVQLAADRGKLELVGRHGEVSEYMMGDALVAYRAPDTVILAGSKRDDGTIAPIAGWEGYLDRLAGLAETYGNPAVRELYDAMAADGAALWGTMLWTDELRALAAEPDASDAEGEPDPFVEQISRQLLAIGATLTLGDSTHVAWLARCRDPGLPALLHMMLESLKTSPPEDLPEPLRVAFSGVDSRVEGSDYRGSIDLTAEQLAELFAKVTADEASETEGAAPPEAETETEGAAPPAATEAPAP
jgi:hypothetical protein